MAGDGRGIGFLDGALDRVCRQYKPERPAPAPFGKFRQIVRAAAAKKQTCRVFETRQVCLLPLTFYSLRVTTNH
jgi:hypothetical protein